MIEPEWPLKPGSSTDPTRSNRPLEVLKGRRVRFGGTVRPLRYSVDGKTT